MNKNQGLVQKLLLCAFLSLSSTSVHAQITPDNTLGTETSKLTPNVLINGASADLINGGALRGNNLFHSFGEFNIKEGQRVYFGNPSGVVNILTRVTGSNASNILGTLGVDGAANLFLINPNGILFGKNASLDVRGSFVGTTANGLQFGNQGNFSATEPSAPGLLTINPSALFFNQINPNAAIQNNSVAPAIDPAGFRAVGLRVPDGKSLLLVGGNVSMDGGQLNAYGGRVELGGILEPGNINLLFDKNNLRLGFPENVTRASVSLTNQAKVNIEGAGKGNIAVNAKLLEMSNSSLIAGIGTGLGDGSTKGGDININADTISLTSGAFISSDTYGKGDAGDITINTANLIVKDSQLGSIVYGEGNAGTVKIIASDSVELSGEIPGDEKGFPGGIFASLDVTGKGKGGRIDIETRRLSVSDGSKVQTATFGEGDAGSLFIRAEEIDVFETEKPNFYSTGIFNTVALDPRTVKPSKGNGGNLTIETKNLSVRLGGNIGVETQGEGNAGSLLIKASNLVEVAGNSPYTSEISAGVTETGVGNGGSITIETPQLNIKDGGIIGSSTFGKGDSGNVDITTGSLSVTNGAQINSFTRGRGNAGNITIRALDVVSFDGSDSNNYSALSSNVLAGGVGNGGIINIEAGSLSLTNGGELRASVNRALDTLAGGQGIGGSININVRDALSISGKNNSGIFAGLGAGAIGRGGNIKIQAGNLLIKDDGEISSSTSGKGDSGNISIAVRDAMFVETGGIYSNVQSRETVGNAGNIDITTGLLSVTNGANVNSFTRGLGSAGNITIQASDAVTIDGTDSNGSKSGLFSIVGNDAIGNGGTISITSGSLSLNNGGRLGIYVSDASDALQGKKAIGGTANINVRDTFSIYGEGSGIFASLGSGVIGTGGDVNIKAGNLTIQDAGEVSSFLAFGAEGRGGNVNIQTGNLFIKNSSEINSSTYGRGNSGNISILARDAIFLDSASYIYNNVQSSDAVGNAGNIDITTGSLKIQDNAGIFAGTFGKGNGGNITVEAREFVEILSDSNFDSGVAQSAEGNAGDATIKTARLIVRDSQIGTSTFGEGNAGNFQIIASDSVELSGQIRRENDAVGFPGGLFAQIDLTGKGRGGNLTIETRRLSVSDGSKIQAATFGDGDAGNVFIRAEEIDLFETEKPNYYNTGIFAGVQTDGRVEDGLIDPRNGRPPKGNGGNLTIEARKLSVRDGAEVFVQTTGDGDAGKLFIRASESVNVTGISTGKLERQRTSKITAGASQRSTGNGGSLTIETPLLNVADGGIISSSSEGKGNAGILIINADTIRLNNKASLTANTQSPNIDPNKEQATINLNTQALILRRNSNITTNAQGANVIGGNININADVLAAFENSDISANSTDSRGGRVKITSLGIFGTQARNFPTLESDITATGASPEFSGTTEINTPDVDLKQGIVELPEEVVDATRQVAQICPREPGAKPLGEFTIIGRGSLPPSPLEALPGTNNITKLATLDGDSNTNVLNVVPNKAQNTIVEAQGWVKNSDGSTELVAMAPQTTPSVRATVPTCPSISPH